MFGMLVFDGVLVFMESVGVWRVLVFGECWCLMESGGVCCLLICMGQGTLFSDLFYFTYLKPCIRLPFVMLVTRVVPRSSEEKLKLLCINCSLSWQLEFSSLWVG